MKLYTLLLIGLLVLSGSLFFFFQKKDSADTSLPKGEEAQPFARFVSDSDQQAVPFPMPEIPELTFPDRTCDVTDYQAVGDGKYVNTESFRLAIADCAQMGGGTVRVPAGTWLTGPIRLQSNINFHLEDGAKILFSNTFSDYLPVVLTRFEGMELYNYSPFISAKDCSHIAITGKGELDGNGDEWLKWNDIMLDSITGQESDSSTPLKKVSTNKLHDMAARGVPVEKRIFGTERDALQPTFIEFMSCNNILVEGVEITNSPGWTLHPVYSENITVKNIFINTSNRNTDGVVIDSSRNVMVKDSSFNTGDDAVVIKSGKDHDGWRVGKPSENIIIHDITVEDGNSGVAIGSEMSGDIRNVLIYKINIQVADFGIRFKSMPGRGGVVENIWVRDVFMRRISYGAIHMDQNYGTPAPGHEKDRLPIFRNIEIKNVECRRTREAITLLGLAESPLSNITLENMLILSSRGVKFEHVENKIVRNVTVTAGRETLRLE